METGRAVVAGPHSAPAKVVYVGVDVDTQADFVEEGGALYVPASPEVRANIGELTQSLRMKIGSVDSHAFDAWEFAENGGPFPPHCQKGTEGWLKIAEARSQKTRFVPMSEEGLVIGEDKAGAGNRPYGPAQFADEVQAGVHGIFEKEVYSMFANPNAEPFIAELVSKISEAEGVPASNVVFAVYGYCTGGYCVDAAATGLAERGYSVVIVEDATAPLNVSHMGKPQDGVSVTRQLAADHKIAITTTSQILA